MMQPDKLLAPKKAEANEPGSPKNILNYNPNMQYRPMGRTGVDVSALGFGMLRLPMLADGKTVDMDQTVRMVRRAIEGGVNYIDTGYVYLGGQSQIAVGKALAGGLCRGGHQGQGLRRLTQVMPIYISCHPIFVMLYLCYKY